MRILIAPDKFKNSLGAKEVARQIAAGLREVLPAAEIVTLPISDGGEGFAEIIGEARGGTWREAEVSDPLGRKVEARFCLIESGKTAVMEMSQASGLGRLKNEGRDPLHSNTFGTGELLLAAARAGASEIIIGLGGSATNDGGMGMARSLGYKFLDPTNRELSETVSELSRLARIEKPRGDLKLPRIVAAVDVRNHLLGEDGATRTFGAQKGATPAQIESLEEVLTRLAEMVWRDLGVDFRQVAGAGAAGGLGFGLMSFCGAEIRSGFEVFAQQTNLEQAICKADVIVTGEGKLDAQTLFGKAPAGIARLAKEKGKAVFAIVGIADGAGRELFDGVFALAQPPVSEGEAMTDTANLLRLRAREFGRILS